MSESSIFTGGCHCGAVRFVANGSPLDSAICHCRSCQKTTGAESVAWVVYPVEQVSWTGERKQYSSSAEVTRSFCPACGCSLTYQNSPTTVDLVMACLDEPERLSPAKEIWLSHRLSWNALNPDLPGHPKFSPEHG